LLSFLYFWKDILRYENIAIGVGLIWTRRNTFNLMNKPISAINICVVPLAHIYSFFMYCLINEQKCFIIGLKPRARSASGFRPNKTRPASLLNGFKHKHNYKFNRYTALLVFFI
jgi:hypothetical protein